jgi:hypothetical protein
VTSQARTSRFDWKLLPIGFFLELDFPFFLSQEILFSQNCSNRDLDRKNLKKKFFFS